MHILTFKYCPVCKGDLEKHEQYLECTSCGEKLYLNPTPGVSVYPVKEGKVLLAKRGIEPFKGEWDSIGGFMNFDETAEECAIRETKEETDFEIKDLFYLGTYASTYGGANDEKVINIYFIAKVKKGGGRPKDDITELKWFPIDEVDKIKSSFNNVADSLKDLQKWCSKNER